MFSCGVLWSLKPDGAPGNGDDGLHLCLPHRALGRHGPAILETSGHHGCHGSPPRPLLLEVGFKLIKQASKNLPHRLIPESPSWLLVKGRVDEALSQLEQVARCNGKEFKVMSCP